jgi:hypothetical protein
MTRQLEQDSEERTKREQLAVLQSVYGGLSASISADGKELLGFSVKLSGGDCLITIRAMDGATSVISFVGSEDLPAALRKVVREAHRGQLRWRGNKYAD